MIPNRDFWILQYFAPSEPRLMLRCLRRIIPAGADVIFDLEDAVQDPFSVANTLHVKNEARRNLVSFIELNHDALRDIPLCVRVNKLSSEHFESDLDSLHSVKDKISWACVVLPKIESPNTTAAYCQLLDSAGIRYREVLPIIESESGVLRLPSILRRLPGNLVRKVHFGHYDFCLDAGIFPILEQTDAEFWRIAVPVIRAVEDAGFHYCHTPCNRARDARAVHALLRTLSGICDRKFGMPALSFEQAYACASYGNTARAVSPTPLPALNDEKKQALAYRIMNQFRAHAGHSRAFAISPDSRFYAPHDYLAAKAFLGKRTLIHEMA
jgi:citrate lyase beta subunit